VLSKILPRSLNEIDCPVPSVLCLCVCIVFAIATQDSFEKRSETLPLSPCNCTECSTESCGTVNSENIRYCIRDFDQECEPGCNTVPAGSTEPLCTSSPLPPPRLCGCEYCTDDICGESWDGLSYCAIGVGQAPYSAQCAEDCYLTFVNDTEQYPYGLCLSQLSTEEVLQCGAISCYRTDCGFVSCGVADGKDTCVRTCHTGCCLDEDSEMCQPCGLKGQLKQEIQDHASAWAGAAVGLIVVSIILTITIVVLVVRKHKEGEPGAYSQM